MHLIRSRETCTQPLCLSLWYTQQQQWMGKVACWLDRVLYNQEGKGLTFMTPVVHQQLCVLALRPWNNVTLTYLKSCCSKELSGYLKYNTWVSGYKTEMNWSNSVTFGMYLVASLYCVSILLFKLLTEVDSNIFPLIGCFCGCRINQPQGI